MELTLPIIKYCASEVARQQAGPTAVYHMCNAWSFAATHAADEERPGVEDLVFLAYHVDPGGNQFHKNSLFNYRLTPATFLHAGPEAAHASVIPQAVSRVINNIPDEAPEDDNEWISIVDEICYALLCIHPWADGNGRTVSLLRNWLLGTLWDPMEMPYYFGDR